MEKGQKTWTLERVFRSGIFWTVSVPLIFIILFIVFMGILEGADFSGNNLILVIMGIGIIPLAILKGMGFTNNGQIVLVFYILFFIGYFTFLAFIKKISKKLLFVISFIILGLLLFGLKGCVQANY